MAKYPPRKPSLLPPPSNKAKAPPIDLSELWSRVRSGAANVAGVRYQLAVTAFMLAGARISPGIRELSPEGLEDIDCQLIDGRSLLVQVKERAGGDGRFGPSDLRSALEHAAEALCLDSRSRLAVVTDAELAGGLSETGFEKSVAEVSPHVAGEMARESEALHRVKLDALLQRAHIVRLEWFAVNEKTRRLLEDSYRLPPAVAAIAYATLLDDVAAMASDQRRTTRDAALRLRPSNLDALVYHIREVVDVEQLDLAEREGFIEPLDFSRPLQTPLERFLLGIDVEPGHIAAGLDVLRADELEQIFAGLRDDNYVLIAGPSGAGKSALLWRAAYEIEGRFRLLRLRRLDFQHVAELVRYLKAQRPSPQAPVLICGDNLGRPALAGWEEAVDQFLELPGVHVLGAVREEDFRASLPRGRARIVRPFLSDRLAEEVVAQLQQRNIPFALEPSEAVPRATGLLMEFVALLVTGRRLRDIVSAQVEERFAPERAVEREILRYVTAAHVYAVEFPATALATLVPALDEMPAALQRLEDEFLVRRVGANRWSGLHELRSRVVTTRLHELPPPSEAETMARLLPVVKDRDRRTLIVAAAIAGLELSPLIGAAEELLATQFVEAIAVYALLEGLIEAEEVSHARVCLEFVRQQAPMQDPVSVLPILQCLRDGSVASFTAGAELDVLAAALPARAPSVAVAVAARLKAKALKAAVAASSVLEGVELLELLAFLGRAVPTGTAQELIDRARVCGETTLMTRAVAAFVQAAPACLPQLDRIAGTLESRLDAIADYRRDVLKWELVSSEQETIVTIAAAEHGNGKLNDRLVGIIRLVYEGCPEVEQVNVYALAADGSRSTLPDGKKSPPRRNVLNPIRDIRRNIAYQEGLYRLAAADSWSERLRRQEKLVREIATALDEGIPRLLNPHDNHSRIRGWLEAVDRIRGGVVRLPTLPLRSASAVDRTDKAKNVLDRLSSALTQLARAVSLRKFDNLIGLGSQLQGAFEDTDTTTEAVAGVGAETRDWPIVKRLLAQIDGLREISDLIASLLLSLQHEQSLLRRVPRRKDETWRGVAVRVVTRTREVLLQQEREALERVIHGLDAELRLIHRPKPGPVRLVSDLWLVVCGLEHWPKVIERLLLLPQEMQLALGFRTYTVATCGGLVLSICAKRLGSHNFSPFFYPVSLEDAAALAQEAGIAYLFSPEVEEALSVYGMVIRASSLAALYRLRDERLSREPERASAIMAIEEASRAIAQVGDTEIREQLMEALTLVQGELDGPRGESLAAKEQRTALNPGQTRASGVVLAVVVSAIRAALQHGL